MSLARVYVMESAFGVVKIGRSRAPERRLKAIEMASGMAVRLAHATDPLENAVLVEATAHRLLNSQRASGEWFRASVEEAVQAVATALQQMTTLTVSPSPTPAMVPLKIKLHRDLLAAVDGYLPTSGNGRQWAIGALLVKGLEAVEREREATRLGNPQ